MSTVKTIIVLIAIGWCAVMMVLYLIQRNFIYFPTAPLASELPTLALETSSGKQRIAILQPGKETAVIYFGGNAEPVEAGAPTILENSGDWTIYLVNYPGYGGSEGTPSEPALIEAGVAVFDAVAERHSKVLVSGRSLGSAVASIVASQRPVDGLTLLTPFESILALARAQYPIFPVRWLLKDHFRADLAAERISAPVLMIVASDDTLTPPASARRLAKRFPNPPEWLSIVGADHLSISNHPEYWSTIREFADRVLLD
ncbi:alpha/beta hydrolase [Gammaproteobacteria bacterium]|nr:alpha/beta hydrolase [Gammaproteobacteria bacterium]